MEGNRRTLKRGRGRRGLLGMQQLQRNKVPGAPRGLLVAYSQERLSIVVVPLCAVAMAVVPVVPGGRSFGTAGQ